MQYWTEVQELKQFDTTFDIIKMPRVMAIQCAILSVEHTIESLYMCNVHEVVDNEIKRQTELLTELESRL